MDPAPLTGATTFFVVDVAAFFTPLLEGGGCTEKSHPLNNECMMHT